MKTIRTIFSALILGAGIIGAIYAGFYIKKNGGVTISEYKSLRQSVYNDNGTLTSLVRDLPDNIIIDYLVKPFIVVDSNRNNFNTAVKDILTFDKKYPGSGSIEVEDMQRYTRAVRMMAAYSEILETTSDERVKEKYERYLEDYDKCLKRDMGLAEIETSSEIVKWEYDLIAYAISLVATVILLTKTILFVGKLVVKISGGMIESE